MKKEWIAKWRSLPLWLKRECVKSVRMGWIYSGDPVIGWSYDNVIGYGDGLREGVEGEVIPISGQFYMEFLRGLIGDMVMPIWGEETDFGIRICCKGEEEWSGEGMDREEAMMELLRVVGEWYWENHCPSLCNINGEELKDPYGGDGGASNFEVEIREGESGPEIYFFDFWAARIFVGKWSKFLTNEGCEETRICAKGYYHGRIQLVEGEFGIYSPDSGGGLISGFNLGNYTYTGVGYPNINISSGYNGITAVGNGGGNVYGGISPGISGLPNFKIKFKN